MKTIKASTVVLNDECFITLCGGYNIPKKRIIDGHVAINDAIITFNDDKSITISGNRIDVRYTDKPIRLKDTDEASLYQINSIMVDWRGRFYIPAGYYLMKDTEKYTVTIQEPWFIDFSGYDFKGGK